MDPLSDTVVFSARRDRESVVLAELLGVRLLSSPFQLLRARPWVVFARLGQEDVHRFRVVSALAGVGGVVLVPYGPAWLLGRSVRRFDRILLPGQDAVSGWCARGAALARLVVVPAAPADEARAALRAVLLEVTATTRTADIRPRPR